MHTYVLISVSGTRPTGFGFCAQAKLAWATHTHTALAGEECPWESCSFIPGSRIMPDCIGVVHLHSASRQLLAHGSESERSFCFSQGLLWAVFIHRLLLVSCTPLTHPLVLCPYGSEREGLFTAWPPDPGLSLAPLRWPSPNCSH